MKDVGLALGGVSPYKTGPEPKTQMSFARKVSSGELQAEWGCS